MFPGLSAFPLTPFTDDRLDEASYARLISRLAAAGVDSIGALGSTGSYAYLDRGERRAALSIAVEHAADTPVIAGIGALRTAQVLALAHDAQEAGVAGVLLPPMTYQELSDAEVLSLYRDVTAELSVPLVVYDNPGTTHFSFSDDLYAQIAQLPQVVSFKIPGAGAVQRVARLRGMLPEHVGIGISGDGYAAAGLNAGCDTWYSVVGGVLPERALAITRAAQGGDAATATALARELLPLWDLFAQHGSLRVVARIAEAQGLVAAECLPRPLQGIPGLDVGEWIR